MKKPDRSVDVVIIGSGAGGGASAWALAQQGIRVLVLESGPEYDPVTDYNLHNTDWEQRGFPNKLPNSHSHYSFAALQSLEPKWDRLRSWNHNTGLSNTGAHRRAWKYHHVRGVGGSTLQFTGEAHRLHPGAMKMRSRYGVAADWPFNYAELEPYYIQAEQLVGVSGPHSQTTRPRSQPYPQPPHPASYASQHVIEATRNQGPHWEANPLAVLSQPQDGRPGCNYCNNCSRGCPRRDKGSVDVTFLREARSSGRCEIVTQATVTQIQAGDNDRVKSLTYVDASGEYHQIATRTLVVACGAIMTPRLLLLSDSRYAPEGLANESGQVGRNLMETLYWSSTGLLKPQLASFRGLPADIISWDHNAPDAIPGVIGGCRLTVGAGQGGLTGPIQYAKRVVKGWGHQHKQRMREVFGHAINVSAIGESLPNARTFVDLDPSKTDPLGQQTARIHAFLDEQELRRLSFMADKCREVLTACKIDDLIEEWGSYDLFSATHVFGTCRMGDDPTTSVVNANGRSHRWQNLYVVDTSVFPSSGGGESPSLTVYALAIRTAERIRAAMARKEI